MALPSFASLWRTAKAVEKVFELDLILDEAVVDLKARLTEIERRLDHLEADRRELVIEAKAAAATAASAAASAHLSELARQVGVLQEQMRAAAGAGVSVPAQPRKRLKPPQG